MALPLLLLLLLTGCGSLRELTESEQTPGPNSWALSGRRSLRSAAFSDQNNKPSLCSLHTVFPFSLRSNGTAAACLHIKKLFAHISEKKKHLCDWMLSAAHVAPSECGCDGRLYQKMINDLCFNHFKEEMGRLDSGTWCSWPETMETYEGLTNCTCQVALRMDCFWPNQLVDDFFMKIHNTYFHHCALTGRLLSEPSIGILTPFIGASMLITLLMTTVVVWRSKRTEGML